MTRGFSICSSGGTWLPDLLLDFDEESHASCSFDDSNILEPHPDEIRLTQEHSYNSFDRQLPKWSYLLDSRRPNFLQDKATFLQLLAIFFCRTVLFNSSFAPCTLRLTCSNWNLGTVFGLNNGGSARGMNDKLTCWNSGADPMIEEGWMGSGHGEMFMVTWWAPLWEVGGESLITWAIVVVSRKTMEWVSLELAIVGRSRGHRFEKPGVGVDLQLE